MSRLFRRAVCWVVLGLGVLPAPGAAQVSPGPLARAHRELEGSLKCTRCHGKGTEGMREKCLSCHKDVAWLMERGRGLHGAPATKAAGCASCHPDHAGLEFALVKWPDGTRERFDHKRAGWALEQSHAKVKCADCHKPANRASAAAALAPEGRSNWTGLEQGCASCHEDVHRGALGAKCTACHDAGKWEVTPGFSHDTTDYALTGEHQQVKCDACHLAARLPLKRDAAGRPVPVYRPLPHATCAACHDDPHQGRFGGNCSACHSTKGFGTISGSGFDHARTPFPLKGKHAGVRCTACHRDFTTEQGRRPAAATCAACHAPDPHAGTATIQGRPADCAACHTEQGFAPSSFPLARHQQSRYPLEGKHAAVRCAACHAKDPAPAAATRLGTARVVLRPGYSACASCHADDHGGQLRTRTGQGECAECHKVAGWKPTAYGAEAHRRTALPLEGRHAAVECRSCHGLDRKGLRPWPAAVGRGGKAGFIFGGVEKGCAECHLDPHSGRLNPPGGCRACHGPDGFRPAAVDVAAHQNFRFRLGGAHRAAACSACHKELASPVPAPAPAPASTLVASGARVRPSTFTADTTCAACHDSVHGSQFEGRKGGSRCDACHDDEAFKPAARFDHDRDATFALGIGHRTVACTACHKATVMVGGVARPVYRPLSGKCESCHLKKPG